MMKRLLAAIAAILFVAAATQDVRAEGNKLTVIVFPGVQNLPMLLAYYVMLTLIGLHVVSSLYHYFIRRDRVLQRMLPGG